jgi:hypothetical protein
MPVDKQHRCFGCGLATCVPSRSVAPSLEGRLLARKAYTAQGSSELQTRKPSARSLSDRG